MEHDWHRETICIDMFQMSAHACYFDWSSWISSILWCNFKYRSHPLENLCQFNLLLFFAGITFFLFFL